MSLSLFLDQLWNSGRVVLHAGARDVSESLPDARAILQQLEPTWRHALASTPPDVDWDAAVWSATQVYRAAHWIALRDYDEHDLRSTPLTPSHQSITASTLYSVDLTMRFLPDLVRLGQTPAEDDPLPPTLLQWASAWPLSSVGIDCQVPMDERHLDVVLSHPCLRTLYIDRIIQREHTQRLQDERVADAIREAIGLQACLAPQLYAALHGEEGEQAR